jgi:hypothetical protein
MIREKVENNMYFFPDRKLLCNLRDQGAIHGLMRKETDRKLLCSLRDQDASWLDTERNPIAGCFAACGEDCCSLQGPARGRV